MADGFLVNTAIDVPVAAASVHDGHALRTDVAAIIALDDAARLREEDPWTAKWTEIVGTRIVARQSRFEVDLNRPREKAVYRVPDDAWGLDVWRETPDEALIEASLARYDAFYLAAHAALSTLQRRWNRFVVLDLHSYNHRRNGPDGPPADPELNPEVNVGTGTMERERWAHVVDQFMHDLASTPVLGRTLDVRENVKFRGGHFSQWVHETFPEHACCIAVAFRKSFMDEWTGEADAAHVDAIGGALAQTIPGLTRSVQSVR